MDNFDVVPVTVGDHMIGTADVLPGTMDNGRPSIHNVTISSETISKLRSGQPFPGSAARHRRREAEFARARRIEEAAEEQARARLRRRGTDGTVSRYDRRSDAFYGPAGRNDSKWQPLKSNGVLVAWAKYEKGKIVNILLETSFAEENCSILTGVTDKDPNAPEEPREPGFYRYSGGAQSMVFLLRDNRAFNQFARENHIDIKENDWQWHVVNDNAKTEPCTWSYIEQALVGDWELVKI